MRPPWMDPDAAGPTARCVTDAAAREAHQWASDVPGGPNAYAVLAAHAEARSWCDRCYVADECLPFALAAEGRDDERGRQGVYGGLGPMERAVLAGRGPKTLDPIPCKTCGNEFTPGSPSARYCRGACRKTVIDKYQGQYRETKRAEARAGASG